MPQILKFKSLELATDLGPAFLRLPRNYIPRIKQLLQVAARAPLPSSTTVLPAQKTKASKHEDDIHSSGLDLGRLRVADHSRLRRKHEINNNLNVEHMSEKRLDQDRKREGQLASLAHFGEQRSKQQGAQSLSEEASRDTSGNPSFHILFDCEVRMSFQTSRRMKDVNN